MEDTSSSSENEDVSQWVIPSEESSESENVSEKKKRDSDKTVREVEEFMQKVCTDPLTPPLSPLKASPLVSPKEVTLPPQGIWFTPEAFESYSMTPSFRTLWKQKNEASLMRAEFERAQLQTKQTKAPELREDITFQPSEKTKEEEGKKEKKAREKKEKKVEEKKEPHQIPAEKISAKKEQTLQKPSEKSISPLKTPEIFEKEKVVQNHHASVLDKVQQEVEKKTKEDEFTQTIPPTKKIRSSCLSAEEHKVFLDLQKKFFQNQQMKSSTVRSGLPSPPSSLSKHELALFQKLGELVQREQQEYRRELYAEGMSEKYLYETMHPLIQQQLESIFARKRERVKKYPRYYNVRSAFDLRTIKVDVTDPVLTHSQTLLQKGKCIIFRRISSPEIPLQIDYYPDEKSLSSYPYPHSHERWTKREMPDLLEDKEIETIVKEHRIDIVLCSSSISAIVDNHGPSFFENWEIPVTVREYQVQDQLGHFKSHKTVFLEKPFVKKKMNFREQQNQFFNIAFRTLGLIPLSPNNYIDFGMNTSEHGNFSTTEENKNWKQPPLDEENLTYNIWNFGNMRVLIRCKIHGFVTDPNSQNGIRFVGTKTKMEYQPNRGKEEVTMSETSRWWIQTFIRPDAHLILGRINAHNSTIMEVEQKDMVNILPPNCLFRPQVASKLLLVVLETLSSFEPGSYILSHKSRDFNVVFYEAVQEEKKTPTEVDTKKRHYDLYETYSTVPQNDTETIPFIPTRWVPKPNQIPETFPISNDQPSTILQGFEKKHPQLCPAFKQFGTCGDSTCTLFHPSQEDTKKETKQASLLKNITYCHSFAHKGFCKAGKECKFPHLTLEEVQKKLEKKTKKQRKRAKKRKKQNENEPSQGPTETSYDILASPTLSSEEERGEGEEEKEQKEIL